MSEWKSIPVLNSDGELPYSITGTATLLKEGSFIAQINGGTNADLSEGSGLLLKDIDGAISLFDLPATTESKVLTLNGGILSWQPTSGLTAVVEGDYISTYTDSVLASLTINGVLDVQGGAIIYGSEELTTTSNVIKLNADGTTPTAGDKYGLKIDVSEDNDPQFYWDYTAQEWVWEGHLDDTGFKVSGVSSGTAEPDTNNYGVGDIFFNTTSNEILINFPS